MKVQGKWIKCILLISIIFFTKKSIGQTVSVSDFGAKPNDTLNDRAFIQKAIDYCQKKGIKKLLFPPGKYRIADPEATKLMNEALSGKFGRDPQDVVFKPYFPYVKGLHLKKIKSLHIEAQGAVLMVEGWMEPISIEQCYNVTIEGLTIDYKDNPHSEGKVIQTGNDFFDISFRETQQSDREMLITRIMFWDLLRNRLLGSTIYFPKKQEWISPQVLRIWKKSPGDLTGKIALINHSMHFRPAILIQSAVNTVLERVTIHSQPGMGIVGNQSTNITMNGLRVVPRSGKYQSTNTDATHFTACKGVIRFDGCAFEGQGDDATNVHGYYHSISKKIATNVYSIQLDTAFTTHAAVLDYPDQRDTMELVRKESLQVAGRYAVLNVDTFPRQWKSHIQLNNPLPDDIQNYYLINISKMPRLEFVNSYVGSHLARGILVKTRSVLIENNEFRESTGTAVHIGAEGNWFEGPGSSDVIIRNNRFFHNGRGDGTISKATAIAINVNAQNMTAPGIHRNILIDGNIISGEPGVSLFGILISGAENVKVSNNRFTGIQKPWSVQHSKNVQFQNNDLDGEAIEENEFK